MPTTRERDARIRQQRQATLIVGGVLASRRRPGRWPKDFPKVSFLMGGSGKPAGAQFLGLSTDRHPGPGLPSGMVAGGMTKSNKIGMVGGFPIPEVNRLMNAFMAGAKEDQS